MDLIENESADKQPPTQTLPGNLQMLVDIYKHHWDLFLKGYAFYLASCALFASFAVPRSDGGAPNIFQKLFSGIAVASASLVAIFGLFVAYNFLGRLSASIDKLCDQHGYVKIYFDAPKQIVRLLQSTAIILFFVGISYVAHVLLFKNGWRELFT
ncbi:MAG: hypothetical protein ABL898_09580 [Hyphomicrobiaceae bacterium]